MTPLEMVREYVSVSRQAPNEEMSLQLIKEEFFEWRDEVLRDPPVYEDELKELADIIYVVYGYANVMGWDMDEALSRVHANNMGRMKQDDGTILRREDGKVLKNKNFPKINLKDLTDV